eukprot:gene9723-21387_t
MFRHQFINHVANGLGVLRSRTYRSIARMKPTATERFWQQPQQQQIQLQLQRRFLATKPTIQIKTNQQKEKIAYFVDSKVDYLTGAEFKTDLVQLCKVFAFWFIQTSVWLSVIRSYIVDIVPCNGPSMLPTVAQQDLFLATPLTLWVRKMMGDKTLGLEKGDVILSLSPQDPDKKVCKRVMGLPGDSVRVGNPLFYDMRPPQYMTVPRGHVWLLGDNATDSNDSRMYGPVALGLVLHKVIASVKPGFLPRLIENDPDYGAEARNVMPPPREPPAYLKQSKGGTDGKGDDSSSSSGGSKGGSVASDPKSGDSSNTKDGSDNAVSTNSGAPPKTNAPVSAAKDEEKAEAKEPKQGNAEAGEKMAGSEAVPDGDGESTTPVRRKAAPAENDASQVQKGKEAAAAAGKPNATAPAAPSAAEAGENLAAATAAPSSNLTEPAAETSMLQNPRKPSARDAALAKLKKGLAFVRTEMAAKQLIGTQEAIEKSSVSRKSRLALLRERSSNSN